MREPVRIMIEHQSKTYMAGCKEDAPLLVCLFFFSSIRNTRGQFELEESKGL